METLLNQLNQADRICSEANVFFEKEAAFQGRADSKRAHLVKNTVRVGLVAFFVGLLLDSELTWLIILIAAAAFFVLTKFKIKDLSEKAASEDKKGMKILEDNYEDLKFLPDDYWYPLATGYLVKIISTQRADSLKEALDMFDAQLHRWKVEEANAEMVAQQQAQTAHLKSIRTSSKINAAANIINGMNNMYNR